MIGCMIYFYKNHHRLLDWYTDLLSSTPRQTIVVSRLGARRAIVTANPENVEYILKTNFYNFPKGKPFQEILEDFLGNGIFNVDGDLWYNQMKLASQEFSTRSLRDYAVRSLKEEVDKKLLPLLESVANDTKKTLDLQDLLKSVTFDVVCKVSLGYDPCCLDYYSLQNSPSIVEAFDMASEVCARRGAAPLSALWKVKRFVGVGSEKRLKEAILQIHMFVGDIIHDKKRKLRERRGRGDEQDLLSKMVLGKLAGFLFFALKA
ncbi:Cytochrome [Abeliophyllum distichum]|uniref:Cytochrome n=1 Tax=Abeliophyllum distichum TaxID=126358 RepID=A0ABD1SY86_9LAMI